MTQGSLTGENRKGETETESIWEELQEEEGLPGRRRAGCRCIR